MQGSRRTRRVLLLVLGCVVSAGCGEKKTGTARPTPTSAGAPVAAPAAARISPQGGALRSADGRLAIEVPPGAVPSSTDFSVQEISNAAPGGLGSAYRLGPDGATFLRPLTFTFVAGWAGTPVDRLTIAYQDHQGYWIRPGQITRDVSARTLTVTATHFSDWAIVSIDPTRDMAGTFTLNDTTDVPFNATGSATLTYSGQDDVERWYVLSGTTTLNQPVSSNGLVCTVNDDPTYKFPSNVAEVLNSPDRFWWGTSAVWNATCGTTPTVLDTTFDTLGIAHATCTRSYLPTALGAAPIITLDRLQGSYQIDCGAGRTVTAAWDFFRCGGGCISSNPCHTAAISCSTSPPTCTDTGNVTDGTACGTNAVCGGGTCNTCTAGAPCTPANPCDVGTTSCSTGFPVCTDTGQPLGNGTSCGTNQVCLNAACTACSAGLGCTVPSDPCHVGVTTCSTGTQQCQATTTNAVNGTSCGANQVCLDGVCNACAAGQACTPSTNPCHVGTTDCSTGTQVCVDSGVSQPNGFSCSTATQSAVCNGGACSACTAGQACTPTTNPCHVGTTDCSTGTQVCVDTGASQPNGTSCGTATQPAVCSGGTCNACSAGQACTPSTNPCHVGTTDCSTGTQVCVDQGTSVTDGTACTGGVCGGGACNACSSGAPCSPTNACHTGTTSCTTGYPVCADTSLNAPNGTSCGTGQVCSSGACISCTAGAACTLVNACVTAGSISCTDGTPTCTATPGAILPDGTACGTNLACSSGSCLEVPCTPSASCVPLNPCDAGTVSCGPPAGCTDTGTPIADGTTCGTNLVCSAGRCAACPAVDGTPCTPTNPCATGGAVRCATGIPVCTATGFVADGTTCGSGLTCSGGTCQ